MVERFANTLVGANTFELRQRPSINMGNITDEPGSPGAAARGSATTTPTTSAERIRTPATFAKYCSDRVTVHYAGKIAKDIDLVGTEDTYFRIRNYELTAGRAFTAQEVRAAQPVLVIGPRVGRASSFPAVDPLGKEVQIGGLPYRVIGVVAKQGTLFGISLDKFAVMPFSAPGRRLICPINILDALIVRTDGPIQMQAALAEAEAAMRSRRQLKPWRGEQFRLPDGGRRAGHLAEDLPDPLPGPAGAGGDLAGGGRHRDHEHHADGGERAHPGDRDPEGARRPAARHPGAVRGRVGDALLRRRGARDRPRARARLRWSRR